MNEGYFFPSVPAFLRSENHVSPLFKKMPLFVDVLFSFSYIGASFLTYFFSSFFPFFAFYTITLNFFMITIISV